MLQKITTNPREINLLDRQKISLNLDKEEEIVHMEVIDKNRLLIIIKSQGGIKGVIYNIEKETISKFIEK